jgi:hypothetical protein
VIKSTYLHSQLTSYNGAAEAEWSRDVRTSGQNPEVVVVGKSLHRKAPSRETVNPPQGRYQACKSRIQDEEDTRSTKG